ncbi:hypothetical protein D3C72_1748300 [compost metagenome]
MMLSSLHVINDATMPIIMAYSCEIGTKYKLSPIAEPIKLDLARSIAIFFDSFSCGEMTSIIDMSVQETEYWGKDTKSG